MESKSSTNAAEIGQERPATRGSSFQYLRAVNDCDTGAPAAARAPVSAPNRLARRPFIAGEYDYAVGADYAREGHHIAEGQISVLIDFED